MPQFKQLFDHNMVYSLIIFNVVNNKLIHDKDLYFVANIYCITSQVPLENLDRDRDLVVGAAEAVEVAVESQEDQEDRDKVSDLNCLVLS